VAGDQRGDGSGRRLHRWRAQRLSEAGRVGRILEGLIRRAGVTDFELDRLLDRLHEAERRELEQAHGRIQPRRRFRGGAAQPLVGRRGRNFLFVDESGQSLPTDLDIFALGAVAFAPDALDQWNDASSKLKVRFGIPNAVFHEPAMRVGHGVWAFGGDAGKRASFNDELLAVLQGIPFTVFGAGVRKDAFKQFVASGVDPYLPTDLYSVAIQLLLERYVDFLAMGPDRSMGRVRFESQGALEDAYHARDYVNVLLDGTQWISGHGFRQWLESGPRFVPKAPGGVEVADMFARDLMEWTRAGCVGSPGRWDFFSERMYCRDDRLMGTFGVKVFPDSDVREAVLEHRRTAGPK
jgi:hypothetical protein